MSTDVSVSMPAAAPPARRGALVAALQWGLVSTFVLDTLGRFLRNYYRATTDAFASPPWVMSVRLAALLGLVVGGYGGYRWVTSGPGATTRTAHRRRVVFVGTLLVGWALAIVPTLLVGAVLDDRLFETPYFVVPTLVALTVLGGASVLAYWTDPARYARHRNRLLGGVQGALCGLLLGVTGFVLYGRYLEATRDQFSVDGSLGIVAVVVGGAVVGLLLVDTDGGSDRAAEFVTLLVLTGLGFPIVAALVFSGLDATGVRSGFGTPYLYPLAPLVSSLGVTAYLTYGRRTALFRRVVDPASGDTGG
jgi:glucose uptake protein GlcU